VSAAQLLPAIRDLYSRLPETYHREPWELQHVLFSLGYVEDMAADAIERYLERLATKEQADLDRKHGEQILGMFKEAERQEREQGDALLDTISRAHQAKAAKE
jgi:hypothetical protein